MAIAIHSGNTSRKGTNSPVWKGSSNPTSGAPSQTASGEKAIRLPYRMMRACWRTMGELAVSWWDSMVPTKTTIPSAA